MADLSPIRSGINYVAELYQDIGYSPVLATAPNNFDRSYNIFHFSAAPLVTDPTNYWIAWGGYFDNPPHHDLIVLMDNFLTEIFSEAALELTQNSFYIDGINHIIYINIPYRPWQYSKIKTAILSDNDTTFASAAKDNSNYSDQLYGSKNIQVRLIAPSIQSKLNNIFVGYSMYNFFSIVLLNNDGYFDSIDIVKFFNTICNIKKDSVGSVSTDDFNLIRRGIINNISKDTEQIIVNCIDTLYLLSNQVCKKITLDDYPNLPDSNINKDLPLAWGTIYNAPLIQIDFDTSSPPLWAKYIVIEKNHIVSIDNVYDKDGNILTHIFDAASGVITVTSLDAGGSVIEGSSSDITASSNNTLGEILTEIIPVTENLPLVEGVWDLTEVAAYMAISPQLGFYFSGGSSKTFLEQLLKNDMCFMILKNDNRLTLRRWGEIYNEWTIPSWLIMNNPVINYSDANTYYVSTIKLEYAKNQSTNKSTQIFIDDTQEQSIFYKYKKSRTGVFQVDILNNLLLSDFSTIILNRFGEIKDTVTVAVGVDTYQVNLLDKIILPMVINGRTVSNYTSWIVKEINPAQDVLVLEGLA